MFNRAWLWMVGIGKKGKGVWDKIPPEYQDKIKDAVKKFAEEQIAKYKGE